MRNMLAIAHKELKSYFAGPIAYSVIAPRNLPMMIWKSVSGDVSNSSTVPDRFSSA